MNNLPNNNILGGAVIEDLLLEMPSGEVPGHLLTLHLDPRLQLPPLPAIWMTDEGLQRLAGVLLEHMRERGLQPQEPPSATRH